MTKQGAIRSILFIFLVQGIWSIWSGWVVAVMIPAFIFGHVFGSITLRDAMEEIRGLRAWQDIHLEGIELYRRITTTMAKEITELTGGAEVSDALKEFEPKIGSWVRRMEALSDERASS